MTRIFRLAVLSGILVALGLAFPSSAAAQRGGGGRGGGAVARGGGPARGGGSVARGGAVYGGNHAVPRTYPPYSSPYYRSYYSHGYYSYPYYSRGYYYRPYYAGYYPYYSPWSFSLSFGWYGGAWYPPSVAYPYYYYPYPTAYPAYPYPSSSQPAYDAMVSPGTPDNSQRGQRTTTGQDDAAAFGTLSIRVVPADATIVIDRHAWESPRGDDHFAIELGAGPHEIEIRKAGYATYVRIIEVPRARALVLNVALTPGGTGSAGSAPVARTVPFPFRH